MRLLLLVALAALGCRRAAPPPVPDAGETLELVPPGEMKQKVEETLEKEHEKTLEPRVE